MLSIPPWELKSGDTSITLSPLTLSRGDIWNYQAKDGTFPNRPLYSHGVYEEYRRAHWNPGVGFWQLDTWKVTINLNHGQRIATYVGGVPVARYLRDGFCAGTAALKKRLNDNWYGCRTDKCWNTYVQTYGSGDSLNVSIDNAVTQRDGGVTSHRCRWGSDGDAFWCRFVNTRRIEGYADTADPEGAKSRTPLAHPFLSLTHADNGNKFAAWLRSGTGYNIEIMRWEPLDQNAHHGGKWYNGTSLEVWKCTDSCWWSTWGLAP